MIATTIKAPAATPLGANFLALPDTADAETEAGIFIPEAERKDCKTATVVKMGGGYKGSLFPGLRVMYAWTPSTTVELDGVTYFLLEDDMVTVVLDEHLVEVE